MSQPCFFAHHNATAESTPPDKRTIARSIRFPPSRLGPQPPRCRPRSGGFRPINICPRLAGWRPKRSSGRGGRREMVRLPEDLELVLDPLQRLALPGREAVPVSVVQDREEMTQPVDNVFRVAG